MRRVAALAAALLLAAPAPAQKLPAPVERGDEPFTFRVVAAGFDFPWEIVWGPDDRLWLTERQGKRVTRVDPASGAKTAAVTIGEAYSGAGQDGVLGLALHPDLLRGDGRDYVYVAYTYNAGTAGAVRRSGKIRRYTYARDTGLLGDPVDLIAGLPASGDHNAGRLVFGPDGKLYYAVGDLGANQFGSFCEPIRSQDLPAAEAVSARDWTAYAGKILRLDPDGGIPDDNPVLAGVRSHVWSYGHRNPQGLAFGADRTLYAAEHGPKTDDEINVIAPGRNYGWPHVAGYRDGKAYVYGAWHQAADPPCPQLRYSDLAIARAVPRYAETAWNHPDFTPPIATLFTVESDFDFADPACGRWTFICWPTIAPSSVLPYDAPAIPGWAGSLLLPSLKHGALYRLKLAPGGRAVAGVPVLYFKTENRYRAAALSPDGRTIYIVTDNSGPTATAAGGATATLAHPGAILAFRYER